MADYYVRLMFIKIAAEVSPDKIEGEMKAEILMGISTFWNDLIISYNEKLITLKVPWPSWAELCGVLGRKLRDVLVLDIRDGLGLDTHFNGCFNFIYNFYYIDPIPPQNREF